MQKSEDYEFNSKILIGEPGNWKTLKSYITEKVVARFG